MLEIDDLAVAYGRTQVLFGATLSVPSDELVVLLGRNGVGKSTLMKATMGLLPTFGGTVRFEGEDITGLAPSQRVQRGIAYVPQGREGFPQLSVRENLQVVLDATSHRDPAPSTRHWICSLASRPSSIVQPGSFRAARSSSSPSPARSSRVRN